MWCSNTFLPIQYLSCCFKQNIATVGGAICLLSSNIVLEGNLFLDNKAASAGGAIVANNSAITLNETLGNTFAHNSAASKGGALYCEIVIFIL